MLGYGFGIKNIRLDFEQFDGSKAVQVAIRWTFVRFEEIRVEEMHREIP